MIYHKFKYTLKILFKNKTLLFWTFIFPIILGTLFNMAFSNIEKEETVKTIPIAIINNNENYASILENIKQDDIKLFKINYKTEKEAKKLLNDEKIAGYIDLKNNDVQLYINKNGINETIIKQVLDEINSQQTIHQLIQNNQTITLPQEIKTKHLDNNLSYTMIEFYSLIAMACMYGSMISKHVLNNEIASITTIGKRNSISPISKLKTIIGSLLASYLVQVIGISLLYLYTIFILKVDYGKHLDKIIILSLFGVLAGLALGMFTSVLFEKNENMQTSFSLTVSMLGSFLAGMMGITTKYFVDTNFPLINKINPVNMITDGLYSLYYYASFDRYYFNILSLFIFSLILIIFVIIKLRRVSYEHL